ncbi:MAG: AmmeMemoRadiSam system protein A [Chloroflexi bacterium]|nr:AmmeMemoRadiSam system protein A [Chloroflexota bacterium]
MFEPLTSDDKRTLLRLARDAVTAAVNGESLIRPELDTLPASLQQIGACFVTLTRDGDLRGCIGGLEADEPLAYDAQDHADQTALYDYRFPPVSPDELDDIEIEVSVLTQPQPLPYDKATDLLRLLRPGVDGVIISSGLRRATFLPQVWERIPDTADFLSLLCQKMGAPEDEWLKVKLEVQTYQAEKFTEAEFK